MVYNIPARAIVEISVETMGRLSKIANIIGVKDATANLARPIRERLACGKDWRPCSPARMARRWLTRPAAAMAASR